MKQFARLLAVALTIVASIGSVRPAFAWNFGEALPGAATVDLPTCDATRKRHLHYDDTTDEVLRCDGSSWAAIGGGSGDVTAVGDCATGDCFQSEAQNTVLGRTAAGSGQLSAVAITAFEAALEGVLDLEDLQGSLTVPGQLNATGTPDATTFLRGDGAWATPSGGDIISEGNSNVEVIDAGTGAVDIDLDGVNQFTFSTHGGGGGQIGGNSPRLAGNWTAGGSFSHTAPNGFLIGTSGNDTTAQYSLQGDTNTGMRLPGGDSIRFITNATARLVIDTSTIEATLPIDGADGSSAAPTYGFASEASLGLYRPGAGLLSVMATTEVARFHSGGVRLGGNSIGFGSAFTGIGTDTGLARNGAGIVAATNGSGGTGGAYGVYSIATDADDYERVRLYYDSGNDRFALAPEFSDGSTGGEEQLLDLALGASGSDVVVLGDRATAPAFDWTGATTWTITNELADRTFDADSSSLDEALDALATLVNDLCTAEVLDCA